MLFNPWLLLAGLSAVALAYGGGFYMGGRMERDDALARLAAAQIAAADQARRVAAAELEQAVIAEKKRGDARVAAAARRARLGDVVQVDPNRDCRLGDPAFRLLGDAVRAANGYPPDAAGSGDAAMPATGAAGRADSRPNR